MAVINSIAILILLISVAVSTTSSSILNFAPIAGHDLIVGSRLPGDKLVYKENIIKNAKWLRVVEVTKEIQTTRDDKITQIIAKDLVTDGTGAYAKVVKGGPLYNNATVKFTSQRSYGINFTLEVYAR